MTETEGLVKTLLSLPIFEAEWVLWLLLALSLASVAIMLERLWFYHRHRVDGETVRRKLDELLSAGDFAGAGTYLAEFDSLETNVALFGLRAHQRGPDAVEELLVGAEGKERLRYSRYLSFLATVGSNAPFIGLFGTVLGIIRAFRDLSDDIANAGGSVMAGISEALVATAVGLLVAIPAVIAYNYFQGRVKSIASQANLLSRTVLAQLKSEPASEG